MTQWITPSFRCVPSLASGMPHSPCSSFSTESSFPASLAGSLSCFSHVREPSAQSPALFSSPVLRASFLNDRLSPGGFRSTYVLGSSPCAVILQHIPDSRCRPLLSSETPSAGPQMHAQFPPQNFRLPQCCQLRKWYHHSPRCSSSDPLRLP